MSEIYHFLQTLFRQTKDFRSFDIHGCHIFGFKFIFTATVAFIVGLVTDREPTVNSRLIQSRPSSKLSKVIQVLERPDEAIHLQIVAVSEYNKASVIMLVTNLKTLLMLEEGKSHHFSKLLKQKTEKGYQVVLKHNINLIRHAQWWCGLIFHC